MCNTRKNFQAILPRLRRGAARYIHAVVSPNLKVVNILPRLQDAERGFFGGLCRLGTPVAIRGLASAAEVPDLIFCLQRVGDSAFVAQYSRRLIEYESGSAAGFRAEKAGRSVSASRTEHSLSEMRIKHVRHN